MMFGFGRGKSRENVKRAERANEKERVKREKWRWIKIYIFFYTIVLQYNSKELYCSTIVKIFTIVVFSIL